MMRIWVVMLVMLWSWRGGIRAEERHEQGQRLMVPMTLVSDAASQGAVCLDGSLPAYHFHTGSGNGVRNWLLQFEGGGWCNDVGSCLERSRSRRGSTSLMNKYEVFSGILSNDPTMNPDFYNWNRVKLRYCDGASFAGDSEYNRTINTLYFRGKRIWDAIIQDLLPKGLMFAEKALLSGCSAGGLATFIHCDEFAQLFPETTTVKCLSDAGFFLDVTDISGNNTIRPYFHNLVNLQRGVHNITVPFYKVPRVPCGHAGFGVHNLQGVLKNLNQDCLSSHLFPYQCFFPQYALRYIRTPYFILNTAYDVYQFHHIFVPPLADRRGVWNRCKFNPAACSSIQLLILQGFRVKMIESLQLFAKSRNGGMYINSCFAHCQSELQNTWFASDSPKLHNKTIAEAVGDWYFERRITKEIDCPYPCDSTCQNSIPLNPEWQ